MKYFIDSLLPLFNEINNRQECARVRIVRTRPGYQTVAAEFKDGTLATFRSDKPQSIQYFDPEDNWLRIAT